MQQIQKEIYTNDKFTLALFVIYTIFDESLNDVQRYYIRTVDFGMHLPSELEIHPFYDT